VKKLAKFGEPDASRICQSFSVTLLAYDEAMTRGEKAEQLLEVLRYMDQFGAYLSEEQFSDMITRAVVACGFDDELDAWHALISILEPGKFVDVQASLGARAEEELLD
jgi:hypothetical protein